MKKQRERVPLKFSRMFNETRKYARRTSKLFTFIALGFVFGLLFDGSIGVVSASKFKPKKGSKSYFLVIEILYEVFEFTIIEIFRNMLHIVLFCGYWIYN